MTNEDKKKLYAALSAPFPEEAIERTDGRTTGRGYSTTGIKAQFVVNRLNEVLGLGNWRVHRTLNVREITTAKGRQAFEAIADVTMEFGEWIEGQFSCWAESLADGGHVAMSEADARKGAFTNAIKRAAAFLGCGKQAYEGTIDEDNTPGVEIGDGKAVSRPPEPRVPSTMQATPATPNTPATPATPVTPSTQATPQRQRSRLTSKQSAAIWSMVGRLNYDKGDFRRKVRERFGSQPEFLTKEQASDLIGILAGQLGGEPVHSSTEPPSNGAAGAAGGF